MSFSFMYTIMVKTVLKDTRITVNEDNRDEQGHHHNGDQAARRIDMMCSICGCRFGCNLEGGLFDPLVW